MAVLLLAKHSQRSTHSTYAHHWKIRKSEILYLNADSTLMT